MINRKFIGKFLLLLALVIIVLYTFWGYTIPRNQIENDIETWLSKEYPPTTTSFTYIEKYEDGRVVFYTGVLANTVVRSNFLVGYKRNISLPLYKREVGLVPVYKGEIGDHLLDMDKYDNFAAIIESFFYDYHALSIINDNIELKVKKEMTFNHLRHFLITIGATLVGVFIGYNKRRQKSRG